MHTLHVYWGQAVRLYGRPRLTDVVDLSIGLSSDGFEQVAKCAERLGLQLIDVGKPASEFVKDSFLFPCHDPGSGLDVEFQFAFFEIQKIAVARAISVEVDGYPIRFARLEDLIVMKIVADRPQDIDDIKWMYVRHSNEIDWNYLRNTLDVYSRMLDDSLTARFDRIVDELRHRFGEV